MRSAGEATNRFGPRLKALRQAAAFTQEELATISGLSVNAISALERGERRQPHVETLRALAAALDLTGSARDELFAIVRADGGEPQVEPVAMPIPPTPLVGREADLDAVSTLMAQPDGRLVTLMGPGGVGKTRLAMALARQFAEQERAEARFVGLASISDPVLVAGTVAEALGVPEINAAALGARLALSRGDRPLLLVLDNFEHLLDARAFVSSLMAAHPALRILVTSRAALNVRGERRYEIAPLRVAAPDEIDPYLEPADPSPSFGFNMANLLGGRAMVASMLTPFVTGIFVGMSWFAVLLLARVVFRRTWLAAVVYLAVWGLAYGAPRAVAGDWADVLQWCLELGFLLFLTLRFGLFAASVFSTLSLLIDHAVLTHDFGAWYGQSSLVATLVLAAVALYGFYTALGGRPLASLAAELPS